MWREDFKPLPTDVWLAELEKLAIRCSRGFGENEDRAVRQAHNLARLSPLPVRKLLAPFASESELESALEDERIEEAARLAIGSAAKIELSDLSNSSRVLASLTFADDKPVEFEASSPALAMIGAWARFLTTVRRN